MAPTPQKVYNLLVPQDEMQLLVAAVGMLAAAEMGDIRGAMNALAASALTKRVYPNVVGRLIDNTLAEAFADLLIDVGAPAPAASNV